ncbi:hypothetical protein D3C73_1391570 [compost metagenome]
MLQKYRGQRQIAKPVAFTRLCALHGVRIKQLLPEHLIAAADSGELESSLAERMRYRFREPLLLQERKIGCCILRAGQDNGIRCAEFCG